MFLRQSTASQSRMVGLFVDDTDFKTVETALTIANTDVKLSKNGAAGVNKNSGGGTHRNNGMYSLTFDATDTDTVGELEGSILVAGALPVVFKFFVLEEAVYDALYAAGALGPLTSIARANFNADTGLQSLRSGTAQAGAAGSITLDAGASAVNNFYEGAFVILTGGTGAGQSRAITSYTGSSKVANVAPNWNTSPDATTTFAISPTAEVIVNNINQSTLALIAGAVWDRLTSALTAVGSIGKLLVDKLTGLPSVTAGANGGLVIAGTNAPITFTGSGPAMQLLSTGGNGEGLRAVGNGVGNGAVFESGSGGAFGDGIGFKSNATDGNGARFTGAGTGIGLLAKGGPNGPGGAFVGGDTSGNGLQCSGIGTDRHGISAVGGSAGASHGLNLLSGGIGSPLALQGPQLGATGNDTTHLHLSAFTYADDAINDYLLVIVDNSSGETHLRWIEDWVAATKLATLDSALPFAPAPGSDRYALVPVTRRDIAERTNIVAVKAVTDALGAAAAAKLNQHSAGVLAVVIGSGSTPTTVKFNTVDGGAPSSVNDFYNGAVLAFISGALNGQRVSITDYDGATTTATISAATSAPANGNVALIA